ncbi:MAG: secretion protein [Caulobacteraceae bacterium]|nr:secretion protein [Caulobacteraceae bacterium]
MGGAAQAAPAERWLAYERRLQDRATDAAGGRFDADYEEALLALTLSFRAEQRGEALAPDRELTRAARAHAADMAQRRFFGHDTPDGFAPIDRTGLTVRMMMGTFGENLAMQTGAPRQVTPRTTFDGWQRSPGHRANLLRSDFTHVGHGVVRIRDAWYSAAVFGGRSASLAEPLPLNAQGAQINAALINAQPNLPAYFVSEPDADPTGEAYPTPGLGPRLPPGAWRIRPLKPRGGRALGVLWGPIVIV